MNRRTTSARRRVTSIVGAVLVVLLAGCGSPSDNGLVPPSSSSPAPSSTSDIVTVTLRPMSTSTTTTTTATTTTVPQATTVAPPPTDAPASSVTPPPPPATVPSVSWPPYEPMPGVTDFAALTGLTVDPATAGRAAVAIKVDNARAARGQWGLDGADVVFEENVEGLTRFVAVFHSRDPVEAGPVRSARTGDLQVLAALNRPVLGWSGGNPGVTAWVEAGHDAGLLVNLSALKHGACYRRESSRKVPHNLIAKLECLRRVGAAAGPARPIWAFLPVGQAPLGEPTETIDVAMDGVKVRWTWDPSIGRYLRFQDGKPHLTAGGVHVSATNVVVMRTVHVPSQVDARTPEAQTVGEGSVIVYSGGVARAGIWRRATQYDPWNFVTQGGDVMGLVPGTTFVELARA